MPQFQTIAGEVRRTTDRALLVYFESAGEEIYGMDLLARTGTPWRARVGPGWSWRGMLGSGTARCGKVLER